MPRARHSFVASFGIALAMSMPSPDAVGGQSSSPTDRRTPAREGAFLERTMDAADRRHLLLRSGIGAAPAELLALEGLTRREGVERVIAGLHTAPGLPMPAWTRAPPPHYHAWQDMNEAARQRFLRRRDEELGELRGWWVREMLATDSPQTERLVLFWHDLFATNYHGTFRRSLAMALQNATFRRLATARWETLLGAMIRDTALLEFLNNDSNRVDAPNENLGRELLELFTLGEGAYTEGDVAEAARALTGHATADIAGYPFRLHTWNQDTGEKTLFGEGVVVDGDDLVERVLEQDAAARYLASRFWQGFVADGEPDAGWLGRIAGRFRESGHDIGVLYRETLSSAAFWAAENRAAIIRSPIDLLVGTARSLDYPKRRWRHLARELGELDMALFAPPDVAGWREGEAYVGGGLLLDRQRLLERHVAPTGEAAGGGPTANGAMSNGAMSAGIMSDETMSNEALSNGAVVDSSVTDDRPAGTLSLRLAAEHYRGPARWRVELRRDGRTLWRDRERTLAHGHDSVRDGRLGDAADMPWQRVDIAVPAEVLARADAVAVSFVNDAAGEAGDRNLFVDGVALSGEWLDAADGRQSGDCPPAAALDAGRLYCGGTLLMERRPEPGRIAAGQAPAGAARAAGAPRWRAASAHVRWANTGETREDGWQIARIALNDVTTPSGAFHRVQFSLVASDTLAPELRLDTFDCVPDCVPRWPDCAWRDERFAVLRTLALPLDGRPSSASEPCHLDGLGERPRKLLAAFGASLPALLERLAVSPGGERFAPTLAALRARLPANAHAEAFVVDPAFAPPAPPRELPDGPPVRAADLNTLLTALDAAELGLVDVLVAGLPDETLAVLEPAGEEPAHETLRRLVRHPLFQLR